MRRKKVTRRQTNIPLVDTALRDVYDKLNKLQATTEESIASSEADEIGDTTVVENSIGGSSLAIFTNNGWMVDVNSQFEPIADKSFAPAFGTDGPDKLPVRHESVKYDLNRNVILKGRDKTQVKMRTTSNKLQIVMDDTSGSEKILEFDGTSQKIIQANNDGNPVYQLGSSDTDCLKIQANYTGSAKTLYSTHFDGITSDDSSPNAGQFFFKVDGVEKLNINDTGAEITAPGTVTETKTALILNNSASASSMTGTGTAIEFNQMAHDAEAPGLIDSALIVAKTEGNWTKTNTNTHDSSLSFHTSLNGTITKRLSIDSGGTSTFYSTANPQINLEYDSTNYATIQTAANGATTLSTVDSDGAVGHLTLAPDGDCIVDLNDVYGSLIVDKDVNNTTGAIQAAALHVDYDRVGAITSGSDVNTGLDVDVNVTGAGTSGSPGIVATGASVTVVGDNAGSGDSYNYGLSIDVTGADNNIGLYIDNANGGDDFKNVSSAASTDYFSIKTIAEGATTLSTVDAGSTVGHLTLDVDGDVILDPHTGITRFYLAGDTNDFASITVAANGVTTIATADDGGTVGHLILDPDGELLLQPATHTYSTNPIGFTQSEPTFNATDTNVRFDATGNKQKVTLTDNCTDIHFRFPAVSGNFICVILQDGTGGRTISNWKTMDSAGNAGAGNSGLVLWAGGTAPSNTETANKADIASFYWDADNEIAYGTYTYNF